MFKYLDNNEHLIDLKTIALSNFLSILPGLPFYLSKNLIAVFVCELIIKV